MKNSEDAEYFIRTLRYVYVILYEKLSTPEGYAGI